jgi:hypothetical protein
MNLHQSEIDSLTRFLRLLATAATLTDLEQHWKGAAAFHAYIDDSDDSRLQQLVTGTRIFALLCKSLSNGLQLLATAAPSPSAAPPTATVVPTERSLTVLTSLITSADTLLDQEHDSQGAAGNRCRDRALASVDASGGLPAAAPVLQAAAQHAPSYVYPCYM